MSDVPICQRCGQPYSVEQPMTSLGLLLAGVLLCGISFAAWWLALSYAPVVAAWMRSW